MYNKVEEQLGRTLNDLEVQMLDGLIQDYSINEIVDCMKQFRGKPLKYIIQVFKNKPKSQKIEWLNKNIMNQNIDEETQKVFDNFNDFLVQFRK